MIVGTLEGQHHLAAALVRDLGFHEYRIDQPLYEMMLMLDPYIIIGEQQIANLRAGGKLSQVIKNVPTWKAARERWPELDRMLVNLDAAVSVVNDDWREWTLTRAAARHALLVVSDVADEGERDVIHGAGGRLVGITGRDRRVDVDHEIAEAPVVDQEVAVVAWVRAQIAATH